MILLYRINSLAIGLATLVLYLILEFAESVHIGVVLGFVVLIAILFARLLQWKKQTFGFWLYVLFVSACIVASAIYFGSEVKLWHIVLASIPAAIFFDWFIKWKPQTTAFWTFFLTPLFFLLASLLFFLFLEFTAIKLLLGVVVTLGVWLYAENLFAFYHLPSSYQAYALEYLSFILFLTGMFFFTAGTYAVQLFLLLPVWIPALVVFWIILFAIEGVFWVSKIVPEKGRVFAFVGAILLTEVYLSVTMLPTFFLVNSAVFTIFFYLYLGITRIHLLDKLSGSLLKRYLFVSTTLLLALFLTASWT